MQKVNLTIKLQLELERMSDEEFNEYMKDKVLVHDGKLYGKEQKQEVENATVQQ
jgi:hypothetical protein